MLVSFTVDPAHDTPPVLAEYARHFKQDPARWFFLTGEMAALNDLGVHAFKLNSVDGSLSHSTRFVLVDRQRRIRGFYGSEEDAFMPKLLHDIRQLERGTYVTPILPTINAVLNATAAVLLVWGYIAHPPQARGTRTAR